MKNENNKTLKDMSMGKSL